MIEFLSKSDLCVVLRMNILQNRKNQQLFVKIKRVKKVTKNGLARGVQPSLSNRLLPTKKEKRHYHS